VSLPGQGPQACWPRSLDDNPLYHPAAGGCFGRASSMATRPPRPEDNVRAYPADFFDDDAGAAIDWPCRYLPARPSTVTKSLASVSADDHELHAHWDPDITMPAATHCFHAEPDVGGRPWPGADHPFCGSLKGIIPCGCGNQNGGDARGADKGAGLRTVIARVSVSRRAWPAGFRWNWQAAYQAEKAAHGGYLSVACCLYLVELTLRLGSTG
jgi:hypothetical protein